MPRRFPKGVKEFIAANDVGRSNEELSELVSEEFGFQMTIPQIKRLKNRMNLCSYLPTGIRPGKPTALYPKHVYEYILMHYKGIGPTQMAEVLSEKFGTNYSTQQLKNFYGRNHLDSGVSGRFEKGNIPHNKGVKGWTPPGVERTGFKKGNLPHNTREVGAERIRKDGYVEVKVRMRPDKNNDNWVAKQRLIWEHANGPIPESMVVAFKDGDKRNFALDNLMLISRADMAQMNNYGLFSENADLTEAGFLMNKLKRAIREKEKGGE